MSTIQEELEEKDMVRTYRIMNGYDKVEKTTFWKMAEARKGPGRRRFKEKEVCRTIAAQRKPIRKQSFASRVQDPWNQLEDRVKLARNPKAFRSELKKAKNIAQLKKQCLVLCNTCIDCEGLSIVRGYLYLSL